MGFLKVFIFTILSFSQVSFALTTKDLSTYKARINQACVASMQALPKAEQIANPTKVCECIASKHINLIKSNSNKAYEQKRLEWTALFYETTDQNALQTMVDKNPRFSDIDFQVTNECM